MKERIETGAASPGVVFVCLLALLGAVVGGVIWAGQIDGQPIPPATVTTPERPEDHSLTDAEAIARFKELDALRIRALEERRQDVLAKAFTRTSPAGRRVRESIRTLVAEKAFAQVQADVLNTRVVRNSPNEIELLQVVVIDVRFVDADGRDVTRSGRRERQRIRWTLKVQDGGWLLHDAVITSARSAE